MAQNTEIQPMEGEVLPPEAQDAGRGGDTVLAHMSLGEIVIPRAFSDDPEVMEMLKALFQQNGVDIREFTVGDKANKINPETGYPEFGLFKSIKKIFKSPIVRTLAPLALSYFAPGLGTALGSSILGAGAAGASTLGSALIGGGVGALTGGGLKGALTGAVTGGIGANIGTLGDAALPDGVAGPVRAPEGILGAVRSATGITNADIPSIGGLYSGNGGGSSTFGTAALANAIGGVNQNDALKKIQKQQLDANNQQLANLESFDPSGITSEPGYQFNLEQGQDALNKSLGAQGNVFSGRAIKEGVNYNQDYASNAFKDYYNRWLTKTGAKNNLIGTGGDIRANTTMGQANNLAQSLSNAFRAPVGAYGGSLDQAALRRALGLGGLAMADLSVYGKLHSFSDYQDEDAKQSLASALQQAQIIGALATAQKAANPDIDKLGESAFLKASQGLPISDTEKAALVYLDNKQQTATFNPVTGVLEQKPSLLDRAGIKLPSGAAPAARAPNFSSGAPNFAPSPAFNAAMTGGAAPAGSGDFLADIAPAGGAVPTATPAPTKNQFDLDYEAQMAANAGNPKAQQELTNNYNKAKTLPNEEQSKAAGFADRMYESNPIISDPNKQKAGTSVVDKVASHVPLLGNFVVSDDFQSFNQAQRDFINAQLRRESGAAISEGEFANARQQYFPQPGDSQQVIDQKTRNREAAIQGMVRSAGASYKVPTTTTPTKPATVADIKQVPVRAAKALKADPSLAAEFDAKYGQGASAAIMGKK